MKIKTFILLSAAALGFSAAKAQIQESTKIENDLLDSLYIKEIEGKHYSGKILHAEPLYIDLIRDLGARKGEKEWNAGFGLTDSEKYSQYSALVEYEWAPVDRLGLEVELPFTLYYPTIPDENNPKNKLNSLKLAAQYTFFVSEKLKTSMALGYIHELELTEFTNYGRKRLHSGNVYNPFFIAAKRWGQNYHTLIYTGPLIEHHFKDNATRIIWQINSNFHYMIDGTRNFLGVEINKEINENGFSMTLRPQIRVGIADNLLIGIVAGIPAGNKEERLSTFLRLIYEPGHRHRPGRPKLSRFK
jgi:hypothetical protein